MGAKEKGDFEILLEKYNEMKAEASQKEYKAHKLGNGLRVEYGSSNITGMPHAKGYVEATIEKNYIKNEEEIEELFKEAEEIRLKITMINDIINTLNDYNREIIQLRYIEKYDISKIAFEKCRRDITIKKAIRNNIEKLEKVYLNYT